MAFCTSCRQVLERGVDREVVVLLQGLQHLLVAQGVAVGPGPHRAFPEVTGRGSAPPGRGR